MQCYSFGPFDIGRMHFNDLTTIPFSRVDFSSAICAQRISEPITEHLTLQDSIWGILTGGFGVIHTTRLRD